MERPTAGRFLFGRQSSLAPSDTGSSATPVPEDLYAIPGEMDGTLQLLYLANNGDLEGIESLLDQGVNVNSADFDNRTALHIAACDGNKEVVDLLIRRGADVNVRDRWGSTPLADAIHYQNKDACKLLKEHGAKLPENDHEASMRVSNPLHIPEYEVNPAELDFTNSIVLRKKTYCVARWRGTEVAVKLLKYSLAEGTEKLNAFRSELALLQKLRHPNVVQFLGAVTQSTPMMIILEFLPKGDLFEYLTKKGGIGITNALEFALDIARGMNYLHEHKPDAIIHRGLKPKNILRDGSGHLKVADFGLSKALNFKFETVQEHGSLPFKNTSYRYMAPEVYKCMAYDRKVDIFSFGLILQEMIEGHPPFYYMEKEEAAKAYAYKNIRPPFKARLYPSKLKRLIEECWDQDPERRPSFTEIIERLDRIKYLSSQNKLWKVAFCCSQF
eukprot:c53552_g1_i1 orf=224-1552(+)